MTDSFSFKNILLTFLAWLAAACGFVVCLIITNLLLPLPKVIMDAVPPSGFLATPMAFLFNSIVNATIILWAARRSIFKGLAMWGGLFVLSFGAQTFMTQVETAYFLSAFPLLRGNFVLYLLVLRGLSTSALFTLLVTLLAGGFSKKSQMQTQFTVTASRFLRSGAWLAAVYVVLYMLFGYFVAWQARELRLFYGGPAGLNSFFAQWGVSLMDKPELPVFQYFRGFLWIMCLVPLWMGFSGKRTELIVLSGLALGLLPTAGLAFANPLMPAGVSYYHFWEVSISTGIFGALCTWFIPQAINGTES